MKTVLKGFFIFALSAYFSSLHAADPHSPFGGSPSGRERSGEIRDGQSFTLPGGLTVRIRVNPSSETEGEIISKDSEEKRIEKIKREISEIEKSEKEEKIGLLGESRNKEDESGALRENVSEEQKASNGEPVDFQAEKKKYEDAMSKLMREEREKLFPKDSEVPINSEYRYFQNSCVYLVSDDPVAVMACSKLVRECTKMFSEYFSENGEKLSFVKLIVFQLITPEKLEKTGMESDFKVGVEILENGEITISARWDKNLKLSEACMLLSGAFLRKISEMEGGDIKESVYWQELAFAKELESRMKTGVIRDMAMAASKYPPPDLKEIFEMSRGKGDAEVNAAKAFWALRSLRQMAPSQGELAKLLRFSQKADSGEKLAESVDREWNASKNKAYWKCVYEGEIWSRLGGVKTPSDSRDEMASMVAIQYSAKDGERRGVSNFSEMWKLREDDNFRAEVSRRTRELRYSLFYVNPLWHNAVVSLGGIFESILNDDEDEFYKFFAEFKKECERASIVSEKAEALMSERDNKK